MLNKTTAASSYRVGAPEEHLLRSVLLRSNTRVGAPEERSVQLLRSMVGDFQERPSPTYRINGSFSLLGRPF